MKNYFIIIILILTTSSALRAQTHYYSLEECINYALENSTDINRAQNNVSIQNAYLGQSKAARLPNLQFGVNQQLSSTSATNSGSNQWTNSANNSVNATLSSQLTLYNGAKLKNTIVQNEINLDAAELDVQTEKEVLSLHVLAYYVEVLLAKDNLKNSQLQFEATQQQLTYAEAKNEAGIISLSDLLYIKSQLASDKTSYVQAESSLRIALVSLMQVLNMPINDDFDILQPDIDELLENKIITNSETVYNTALGIQPNIEVAGLNVKRAETAISIAKSAALPSLMLNSGISTGYGTNFNVVGLNQSNSNINPYIGLSLSVPIYQRKQVKTQVKVAQIQVNNMNLELVDMKNSLRKYIEQVCTDAQTAQNNYLALQEQLNAVIEASRVAEEMFKQGMINSVDFLLSKNNLIIAENKFTQAKYNLILQNKMIAYYLGNSILF